MLGQTHEKNAFLAELTPSEFAALRAHLAPLDLRVGDCLHYLGDALDDVVFPHSGLVAMTAPLRDNPGAAALLIGRDGIVGVAAAVAAAPAIADAQIQIGGHASRMSASAFRYILDQSPSIRRRVARFINAMMAQAQQTALCHAAHPVESRICRWLLEIQARGSGDKVPLTQSTLSQLLGVRRTTVTLVAGRLEAAGVLKCHRGYMQIVSQQDLERRSCECHALLKRYVSKLGGAAPETTSTYARAISPDRTQTRLA